MDNPSPEKIEFPRMNGERIVALLPGSRVGEFERLAEPMCRGFFAANEKLKNLRALISIAPELRGENQVGALFRYLKIDPTIGQKERLEKIRAVCEAKDRTLQRPLHFPTSFPTLS